MRRLFPLLALCALSAALHAQTLDPRHFKVEYEDERVRVTRVTLAPGESTGVVEFNERINVSATDGKIKVAFNGKDLGVFDVKAGTVRHEPAASFSIENAGTREFQTVITEFKGQYARSLAPPPSAE